MYNAPIRDVECSHREMCHILLAKMWNAPSGRGVVCSPLPKYVELNNLAVAVVKMAYVRVIENTIPLLSPCTHEREERLRSLGVRMTSTGA